MIPVPGGLPFLAIAGLNKTHPSREGTTTALRDVTLAIGDTEIVSLGEPSGCGKSTPLRCVAGLEQPSRGSILLSGQSVTLPPDNMRIVFQRDLELQGLWLDDAKTVLFITHGIREAGTSCATATACRAKRAWLDRDGTGCG